MTIILCCSLWVLLALDMMHLLCDQTPIINLQIIRPATRSKTHYNNKYFHIINQHAPPLSPFHYRLKRVNLTKALQLLVIKAGAAGYLRVPVFLFSGEIFPHW
jgi:hypothetical protein